MHQISFFAMLASIQLDSNFMLHAGKIEIVFSNRMLPAKFVSDESMGAQMPPEFLFDFSAVMAQIAGAGDLRR